MEQHGRNELLLELLKHGKQYQYQSLVDIKVQLLQMAVSIHRLTMEHHGHNETLEAEIGIQYHYPIRDNIKLQYIIKGVYGYHLTME
jgi:hypothetical protein